MNKCRNCGASEIDELGPIGQVAPFFLKRVMGLELRHRTTPKPWKQAIREIISVPASLLSRVTGQFAFVEIQICSRCSFIQSKNPFHDDDIMRLYRDYRSPSYNAERIKYEPSYAAIANSVGQDQVEIQNRTSALATFLRRHLAVEPRTLLDYGGSDGRFIPGITGAKYVFEVSDIEPIAGVTRINSQQELGSYSLVLLAHVVEHVPYPLDLVRKVASYVEPDGYLYVETPQEIPDDVRVALKSRAIRLDIAIHEHINSYCISAVSHLLEAADLHVVAIESTPVDVGWAKATHIRALGRKSA